MTTPFYHKRTLALLGSERAASNQPIARLHNWAAANTVALPAAFVEWAELGGQFLLEKYSNSDWVFIEEPKLIDMPDGLSGLHFFWESQHNFRLALVLNGEPDPPVLFSWVRDPWIPHTPRFSDCIYAQIFDWQYKLLFDPVHGSPVYGFVDMAYTGDINLRGHGCLDYLRSHFEETVQSSFNCDETGYREFRFLQSLAERINVLVHGEDAHITVSAQTEAQVGALEGRLLEAFGWQAVPRSFNSVKWAMSRLRHFIDDGWMPQLRYSFLKPPSEDLLGRLIACHREKPLHERFGELRFPVGSERFTIDGGEGGPEIHFKAQNLHWFWLESLS